MAQLASWIRASDDTDFASFFTPHVDLEVRNARLTPVDMEAMDGLLITGGPDISPEFHNVPITSPELIYDAEPERDAWEFAALQRAVERGLPIFCVCKGMQVLNVALGGTLMLDIRGHDMPELKRRNVQPLRYAASAQHRFELVNSSHHQALEQLAPILEVEAWSSADEIVEQVRVKNYPWALGVQYHPERDPSYAPLFEDFVRQVQAYASSHVHRSA
jgi:putative glutamine amidotransferase